MDENILIQAVANVLIGQKVDALILTEFKFIDENTSVDNDNGEIMIKSLGCSLQSEIDIEYATYLYQFTIGIILPQTYNENTMYSKTLEVRNAFKRTPVVINDPSIFDIGGVIFSSNTLIQHTDNIQYRELNFQISVIETS